MIAGYLGQMQQGMPFSQFNLWKSQQINYQQLHNNLEKENSALKSQLEEKDKIIK